MSLVLSVRMLSGSQELVTVAPEMSIAELQSRYKDGLSEFDEVRFFAGADEITSGTLSEAGLLSGAEVQMVQSKSFSAAFLALQEVRRFVTVDGDGIPSREKLNKAFAALTYIGQLGELSGPDCDSLCSFMQSGIFVGIFVHCSCISDSDKHDFTEAFGSALGRVYPDPSANIPRLVELIPEDGDWWYDWWYGFAIMKALEEMDCRQEGALSRHSVAISELSIRVIEHMYPNNQAFIWGSYKVMELASRLLAKLSGCSAIPILQRAAAADPLHMNELHDQYLQWKAAAKEAIEAITLREQQAQMDLDRAVFESKADIPPLGWPLNPEGVVILRLTRHARSQQLIHVLLTSPALALCRNRLEAAGCEMIPEWANQAKLLIPLTEDMLRELKIYDSSCALSHEHVIALGSDVPRIREALRELKDSMRPRLSPHHRAIARCQAVDEPAPETQEDERYHDDNNSDNDSIIDVEVLQEYAPSTDSSFGFPEYGK